MTYADVFPTYVMSCTQTHITDTSAHQQRAPQRSRSREDSRPLRGLAQEVGFGTGEQLAHPRAELIVVIFVQHKECSLGREYESGTCIPIRLCGPLRLRPLLLSECGECARVFGVAVAVVKLLRNPQAHGSAREGDAD